MNNYDYFFKNLFSLNNILNNLIVLELEGNYFNNNYIQIKGDSFEDINNFRHIEKISLNYIIFEESFILKLYNLKELKLDKCENIAFDDKNPFNLKILKIKMGIINKSKSLIKLTELEECDLFRNFNYMQEEYDKIIDFKSLIKLKILIMEFKEFKNIEDIPYLLSLEELKLKHTHLIDEEYIKKILLFNKLKFLDLQIYKIDYSEIENINIKNNSVTKIKIEWKCENDCLINILQEKFPNLTTIEINLLDKENENRAKIIEIKDNKDCKVNTFNINGEINKKLSFLCDSYENLKEINISLSCENEINDIKSIIPIFKDNSTLIFKSLNVFIFSYNQNVDLNFLNNIYNNINNMPNLKYFKLTLISKDINDDFLKKMIRKLLSINLDTCILRIQKKLLNIWEPDIFKKEELREIFPKMKNYCLYDKIYIEKIKEYFEIFDFEFIK